MTIFATIKDYFGSHITGIAVDNISVNDFILGDLTVTAVEESQHDEIGLGYIITVEETFYKGLIVARTATALGRGYYSIGSVTPVFSAEWSAYVCVTTENTVNSAAWSNYVCELEEEVVPIARTITVSLHPDSTGTPPSGNPYIVESTPYYDGDTITLRADDNVPDGYFQSFETFVGGSWTPFSSTSPQEVTVSGNAQYRALYSDAAT